MPPFNHDNVRQALFLEHRQIFLRNGSGYLMGTKEPDSVIAGGIFNPFALRYHCRMIRRPLLLAILLAILPLRAAASEDSELDLRTIPIGRWLDAADTAGIPWRVTVGKPGLRMD